MTRGLRKSCRSNGSALLPGSSLICSPPLGFTTYQPCTGRRGRTTWPIPCKLGFERCRDGAGVERSSVAKDNELSW